MTHRVAKRRGAFAAAVLFCAALVGPGCGGVDGTAFGPVARDPTLVTTLDGMPLATPVFPADVERSRKDALRDARTVHLDALIWYGRRTAYLGRYREAIEVFTRGVEMHSSSAELLRHRGHRYITVREFDRAEADLRRGLDLALNGADRVEQDGLPNARGIPTSTLYFNLYYHLGLALYLQGEWAKAEAAWRGCLETTQTTCRNPDALCAATYWLYLTMRRQGNLTAARALLEPIHRNLDVIENQSYHRLLLLFGGELEEAAILLEGSEDPTMAYGLARWAAMEGRGDEANRRLRSLVEMDESQGNARWASFGFIAAEADLAR